MTKEEALDAIWMRCRHNDKTYEAYCVLTRELGLTELGGGDRVKPELKIELNELEPCADCVSRKLAIKLFNDYAEEVNQDTDIHEAIEIVLNLPSVKPAEKMGHWYKKSHEICYTCDQCRTTNASGMKYNFCPHCGAKMEVEE